MHWLCQATRNSSDVAHTMIMNSDAAHNSMRAQLACSYCQQTLTCARNTFDTHTATICNDQTRRAWFLDDPPTRLRYLTRTIVPTRQLDLKFYMMRSTWRIARKDMQCRSNRTKPVHLVITTIDLQQLSTFIDIRKHNHVCDHAARDVTEQTITLQSHWRSSFRC